MPEAARFSWLEDVGKGLRASLGEEKRPLPARFSWLRDAHGRVQRPWLRKSGIRASLDEETVRREADADYELAARAGKEATGARARAVEPRTTSSGS
ncbi:MAG: hypothetical protein JWR06_2942 [Jatrophihabitans sp.]|nr:hypothetical protein [Jatrophihabitans sp.]